MSLRPYQIEARDAVHASWREHRSVLLVMATGTGKTVTAGEILRERAHEGRILWLAHRSELLDQATATLEKRIGLSCELEKAQSRARCGSLFDASVVVGSVPTLRGERLREWAPDSFATIVYDEAHHAVARGARAILSHFSVAKVLGMTATADRGDGVGLGAVFDKTAFEYPIRQAIQEGYLCPIVQGSEEVADLDLSDVATVAGDLDRVELERRLMLDEGSYKIAVPLIRRAEERPTIVFTAGVKQSEELARVIGEQLGATDQAVHVDGQTPSEIRAERVTDFIAGRVQYLVNCAVFVEGFNAPKTACIAMARPTKSRALYAQKIGRGTRLAEGKADCLVIDFVGNAGRHRLVSALDVLAGRPIPPDVERAARQLAAEGMPSEEALSKAEADAVERERVREERRLREKARLRVDVASTFTPIDPFRAVCERDGFTARPGPRATDPQMDALRREGYRGSRPSRAEASRALARRSCSQPQARFLASKGVDPAGVTKEEASKLFVQIKANRWKAPPWMLEEYGGDRAAE